MRDGVQVVSVRVSCVVCRVSCVVCRVSCVVLSMRVSVCLCVGYACWVCVCVVSCWSVSE